MDYLTTAIVSVISVFFGYLVSLWRSRLLPWISLLEFSDSRKPADSVKLTKQLSTASKKSWHMENLPDEIGMLGEVYDAFKAAKFRLEINEGND